MQWPALESLNSGRRPTTAAPQDEQQRKVEGGRDEREKMSKPKQLISKLIFFVFVSKETIRKNRKRMRERLNISVTLDFSLNVRSPSGCGNSVLEGLVTLKSGTGA